MAPITCANCRTPNPADTSYCGNCGAELPVEGLIIHQPSAIQIGDKPLATPQVKALAVTVAVGVATILAEAGLAYLQRRVSEMERPSFSLRRKKARAQQTAIVPARKAQKSGSVITIVSERVVEEKRWGRPVRRVVERFAWRGEERNS